MENLEDLVNLEELYLSHNGLGKIEGLEKNVRHISEELGVSLGVGVITDPTGL